MLTKYRKQVDKLNTTKNLLKAQIKNHKKLIGDLTYELESLQEARELFKKASIMTKNYLADHLSSIVTKALRTVFVGKNLSFCVEFVERRNVTECDLFIQEDEHRYSIFGAKGGGVVDIISFALKISYILLKNVERILIIDEPFRNLDVNKHEVASMMIKELSKELDFQFIIATHVPALKEYADKSFEVIMDENKESEIY